ncbi:MAG TPA: Fe-S cluster assembly protein SufD [Nevskia sp.]|nr:Fe-S cluster assembly protein SufD [Nevskia sp.]
MSLAAYAESFERFAAGLPEPQRAARRAELQRFLDAGFPTPRIEEWHYTDLAPLADRSFTLAGPAAAFAFEPLPGADQLVYLNGRLDRARSTAPELHADHLPEQAGSDSVSALNGAFASGGLHLQLARGQALPRPLQVVLAGVAGEAPAMVHQRHRIELGDNAEATLVFQFLGQGGGRLATQVIEVNLGPGARLNLYRVQDEQAEATLLSRIDARLDRDSRLTAVVVDCGSGLVRHDFNVSLAAPGAEVALAGLYQPAPGSHLDNHTRIVHAAPHCRSRERFKGIVDARAKAVFVGKVVVQPGAQKTDSEQHIANLLLSKKAEVNAKPELEIYADDVKCAHGATVGQLDDVALEYLRSRGIAAAEARAMLLRAFGAEVLERIGLPALRARLAARMGLGAEGAPAEIE